MNTPKLAWYQLSRDEIPATTLGTGAHAHKQQQSSPSRAINPDMVGSVGFAWEASHSLEYHAPTAFVLHQQSMAETLSWLRVYARDSFPLSQFGRVVSTDDWDMISIEDGPSHSFRDDRWASVVLGELLAQSEHDITLDTLSLSRVQACFSIAIARAHKFYDSHRVTRACTERLRAIEADSRFLRRSINVDALVPIWSLASASFGHISNMRDLADFTLTAASSYERPTQSGLPGLADHLPEALFSESIEERVVAFQSVASSAVEGGASSPANSSSYPAAVVAAAAFLVGKGTSHAFLLRKYSKLAPTAHVWFGLMAGLAGPSYWDPLWTKALKGVEKHVKVSFSWADPPLSDISWAEHNWVSGVIRGIQAFQGIPRQVQAALSIEIFPGVSCQMRLNTDDGRKKVAIAVSHPSPPQSQTQARQPLSQELISAIEELHRYSEKARVLVRKELHVADDLFKPAVVAKGKKVSKKPKN